MAALSPRGFRLLHHLAQKSSWEIRRHAAALQRRFGVLTVLVPAAVAICAAAILFTSMQQRIHDETRRELGERARAAPSASLLVGALAQGRARLGEFETLLPEHEDIPAAVASLLGMARDAGISIKRGEYKLLVDSAGGFARYQMALPVSGDPAAVVGFLRAAMLEHRTLTIESVRFARPQANARQVEARVQWILLTRLPKVAEDGATQRRVAAEGGQRVTP